MPSVHSSESLPPASPALERGKEAEVRESPADDQQLPVEALVESPTTVAASSSTSSPAASPPNAEAPVTQTQPDGFVDIQLIPYAEPPATPLPGLELIERKIKEGMVVKIGRMVVRDGQPQVRQGKTSELDVWYTSKVVSRNHAEVWIRDGQKIYIKDIGSSSGTFLNKMRLSPSGKESRPYPVKESDVIQFGVDYKGKSEVGFFDQSWVKTHRKNANPVRFRTALKSLLAASNPYGSSKAPEADTEEDTASTDCCICIGAVGPFQALFIAPCSHCFHFKCVNSLILQSAMFQCPLCRQVANLAASVSMESLMDDEKAGDNAVSAKAENDDGAGGSKKIDYGDESEHDGDADDDDCAQEPEGETIPGDGAANRGAGALGVPFAKVPVNGLALPENTHDRMRSNASSAGSASSGASNPVPRRMSKSPQTRDSQQSARNIRMASAGNFNGFLSQKPPSAGGAAGYHHGHNNKQRLGARSRRPVSSMMSGSNSFGTYGQPSARPPGDSNQPRGNVDNASVYSSNLVERLKEVGHPLRGPIMIQMTIHYIYFLLVLTIANFSYWAPYIRIYEGYLYAAVAFITLQISRMAYAYSPNSVLPLYMSFIPFAILIFISREVHQLVMVLWYVSFLVIYLQSGHDEMQKHLILYSVVLLVIYSLCILGMSAFYKAGCHQTFCGIGLSDPINARNEIVLGAACVMVVICFIMLEKFIKMNASTLLEREYAMNQLYMANIDLKKQLRRARNDEEVDLEAPLSRATQILRELKDTEDVDRSIAEEIDFIIEILSADQLYNPNLYQKPADADVHDWLNDMLLPAASRTPGEVKGTRTNSMRSNPSFALMGVPDGFPHQKEVSFSPSIDNVITSNDSKIFAMLEDIHNPNFDILELEKPTNGRVLYYVGWYVFRFHDIFERYNLPESRFRHWLTRVESGYKPSNPYHNAMHAADVLHSMHFYVTRKRLWNHLTVDEQIASLVAPIIHDYMHPGVNNSFLISTLSPLTIRYNDQSVLENFHCASIFELMQTEEYDIFANFATESRRLIRESVVSMVLATDMVMHFDWVGKFKNKLNGNGFNFENRLDRKLILNIAIKCADINNPAKPNEYCKRWTDLICEEFFRQGDEEEKKGLPVSLFMGRHTTDIPKCQIGFIDFIVQPLFEAWSGFMMEDLKTQMENITYNKAYWKAKSEKLSHSVAGSQIVAL
ncbi:High affinity cAMP-specific 3',5'-cyclic phosphodiesterase 7A [Irineochytrium annulatum]|nr:High affinity cAMP-specific 3',5'-cyclic phosphodiesterase 7A [Irineochytrium annulatum]